MAKNLSTKIEISAVDQASAVVKKVGKEFDAFGEKVDKVRGNIGGAFLGLGAGALGAVGGGLGLGEVLSQSAAYETAVTNMAKVTDRSFSQVKADVAGLSPELGSQTQLMQGYYAVMSAGVTDSTQALDLLTVASQGSKAAQVTQAQTITALTKVMAGYAGEIKTATEASDLLFSIEKQGQTTFAELVPIIGDVAAISKQASVSSDEMGAMFAAITQTAGGTSQAATQYRAVLVSLIKPQEQMRSLLNDMGYSSGEALIKQKGLAGALMAVYDASKKSGVELGRLFESSEALTALGPLLATNFARVTANMDTMQNKAGATSRAWENYKNTLAGLWDTTRNSFNDLTVGAGEMVAPGAVEGLHALNSALGIVRDNLDSIADASLAASAAMLSIYAARSMRDNVAPFATKQIDTIKEYKFALIDAAKQELASAQASQQSYEARKSAAGAILQKARAEEADASAIGKKIGITIQQEAAFRRLIAAEKAYAIASVEATAASNALSTSMAAASGAATRARLATSAVDSLKKAGMGLVGFLGGPWGAGLTAAAVGVSFLYSSIQDREALLDKYSKGIQNIGNAADGTAQKIDAATASMARSNVNTAQNNLKKIQDDYKAIFEEVRSYAESPSNSMLGFGSGFSESASKAVDELAVLKRVLEKEISPYEAQQQIMQIGVAGSQASRIVEALATAFREEANAAAQLGEQKKSLNDIEHAASGAATGFNELAAAMDLLSGRSVAPANSLEGAIKRLRDLTKETESAKKETAALSKEQAKKDLRTLEWGIYGARQSGDSDAAQKLQAEYDKQTKRIPEIGAKSSTGGTGKTESARRSLEGLNAEIAKLRGEGESFDYTLSKKLMEIAKLGKDAGLSLGEITAKQKEFADAATTKRTDDLARALADVDAQVASMWGNQSQSRGIKLEEDVKKLRDELTRLGAEAPVIEEKLAKFRKGSAQLSLVKDAEAAASFYKELGDLSGSYGLSIQHQNELLRLQADNLVMNVGISREMADEWLRLKELEFARDPMSGLERGMHKYTAEATNYAAKFESAWTGAMSGFEDVWVRAMTTGKLSFSDLTNSILADMARMAVKQSMGGLMGGLGNLLGGLFKGGDLFGGAYSSGVVQTVPRPPVGASHGGGIIGFGQYSSIVRDNPLLYANAPRYHDGYGLKADERRAILQTGETVLSRSDSRYFKNMLKNLNNSKNFMPPMARFPQPAAQASQVVNNITITPPSGYDAQEERKPNNQGGEDIRVTFSRMMAAEAGTYGSPLNKSLRSQGLRTPVVRQG